MGKEAFTVLLKDLKETFFLDLNLQLRDHLSAPDALKKALADILKEELLNLREENEGVNIILKQANKRVKKDKFSSFEYALYYIKQEEARKKKKKRFNAKEWQFLN